MRKRDSKPGALPSYDLERQAIGDGFGVVAGVDEAGRGPWAGPVVAAAVVLDGGNIPVGLNDSKKLTAAARETLFDAIFATAEVGIGIGDLARIDTDNILQATLWAMADALRQLPSAPGLALIDGNKAPQLDCESRTVVKGDAVCVSIAAASIVAKVTRDRIMADLDAQFPGYGFARHKGYGTAAHRAALDEKGPCPAHRRSFAPIRVLLQTVAD